MSKYSSYQTNKAKKSNIVWKESLRCFIVNNKYQVRSNKKGGWCCNCKWCNDGKSKDKLCSNVLGLLYHYSFNKYKKEIENYTK